ncbi:MAG: ABC-F family ATP-binding cassette domain-containing protein, partial [Spirochaetes bacterium]|nr:ABC-F family ATP-binding cassette domain-containing protein [Spirochaetota bacterium]
GARDILQDAALYLASGTKAALAGPNGAGKTTLLRIITGDLPADSGDRAVQKDTRIAWLPQSGVDYRGCSIYEEAEKAYGAIEDLLQRRESIGRDLQQSKADDKRTMLLLEQFHHIDESVNDSGYYRRKDRIREVLQGLGFDPADLDRPVETLSGGWQMRVGLAKVILASPDIMLLDEPTNYLDLEARSWLENFLQNYRGGFIVVSHDRSFLDACINEVYELLHGKLSRYPGNYSQYEQRRSAELETLFAEWEAQQEEIAKLEDFIRRFRYQATKAAQVQSRVKQLNKIEPIVIPEGMKKMHFSFPPPPHAGKIALSLDKVAKSYGDKKVVDELSLTIDTGDKIAFVGRNGAGKSTLMRLIAGVDSNFSGERRYGTGITTAYFSQDVADALDESKTVIEEVESSCPTHLIPSLRNMLGAFLFRGDDIEKKVKVLSGGERSRVALLKMLLHPANLLVLDEPTNHLDLNSKDVLLEALQRFEGTVLFVSHDRFFIEELATRVLELNCGSSPRLFHGDYKYYLQKKALEAAGQNGGSAVSGSAVSGSAVSGSAGSASDTAPDRLNPAAAAEPAGGRRSGAAPQGWGADPNDGLDSKTRRELDKKRKSEKRRLLRREEELVQHSDELDQERQQTKEAMSLSENYSDGARMKQLQQELENLDKAAAVNAEEWEQVAQELENYSDVSD